ncbi:MAG: sodium-dependent transporter [Victivallales bacterium]|nr:sodium-dependent transporter [Victivallales bacterium]
MENENHRETLATRLGFLLLSAGCAVGLGNVWRFPYIVGKYGGGIFVFLYLFFLIVLGLPVLMIELAIGRAGRANLVGATEKLSEGRHTRLWGTLFRCTFFGNACLMMYYTSVSGWLIAYATNFLTGDLMKVTGPEAVGNYFGELLASPGRQTGYMLLAVAVSTLLCCGSLRNTVERSVKYMMSALFLMMLVLIVNSFYMPNAAEGLKFYLTPNWQNFSSHIWETVFAAWGQAFFTLSLGVGSMTIFGSYIGWKKPLITEASHIVVLDTAVALAAGLIIFPICASYGVDVGGGPGLIFVSLPNLFQQMPGGSFWGFLFFAFLSLAALTTIVAVFENMIAFLMDECKFSRPSAALTVGIGIAVLSMPCVLGPNLLKSFQPLGEGSGVLDLEDFIVSQNLLPLGSLLMALFCTLSAGWGRKGFEAEINAALRKPMPSAFFFYCRWILPIIILIVFAMGYYHTFRS